MTTTFDPSALMGCTACDRQGNKIGKVAQVYLDDETGQPSWVAINTGLFGTRQSFAPLQGATHEGDDLVLPFDKDLVKDAPNLDPEGHLDPAEEQQLYQYYAAYLEAGAATGTGMADTGMADTGTTSREISGSTDKAMTRSEEQVRVGTQPVETGRARLRKYVVTENVTQTVPVSREEVRLEREPPEGHGQD